MKPICKLLTPHLKSISVAALLLVALLPLCAQSRKVDFKLTVLNSIGEPQKNMYLQIKGFSGRHEIDEKGVILFDSYLSKDNVRTAELFFKDNEVSPVRSFELKEESREQMMYINSSEDILRFKQENQQVEVEGILVDEEGKPIEGATISILGTGSQTKSDEIGLFQIITDYNHPIIIRAHGMETMTMAADVFIRNSDEAMTVTLKSRNSDYIYSVADEMPVFRGGMKYFAKYLSNVAAYPEEKEKSGIEGVVVIQFVVEKDGSITQPKIVRHLDAELDSIAFRAIESSPRWIPAKDAGRAVRCRYSMPVSFKIPKPEPVIPAEKPESSVMDRLKADSLLADSLRADSLLADSLRADSIRLKLMADSIQQRTDSLMRDSLRMDSISKATTKVEKKVKKRPCGFIRFFRRLFGIKRGEDIGREEVSAATSVKNDKDKPKRKKRRRKQMEDAVVEKDSTVVTDMPPHIESPVKNEKEENNTKNINL